MSKDGDMAQVVVEFGAADLASVLDAMISLMERPTTVAMEFRSGGGETLPATKEALEGIPEKFSHGGVAAVTFRTEIEEIRYGLILEPRFGSQGISMWLGTIELTTEKWRRYWEKLLKCDGLAFVCVGDEEGVELNDGMLTVDSFPWDEGPLLIAALRDGKIATIDWVIRERVNRAAVGGEAALG